MHTVHAPELEPAAAWLGTDRPLSIRALRGHVVLLDFWTYCCINCQHVLPILADLERRYAREPVVVIGVHSAKFATEGDPARVADAMARHGVTHPVVVDEAMGIWERYAVRSWPTLVVVRPDGRIAAVAPGEPDPAMLDALVAELLREARAKGTLAPARLDLTHGAADDDRALRFPAGLSVAPDGRVALADAGHHRVLITDRDGRTLSTIGDGFAGLVDGDAGFARFRSPQGVAWDGELVWVADTGNHCVRVIDLAEGTVTRVAGTGLMGAMVVRDPVAARTCALRSPWSLSVDDDAVIVSMAGAHQLWRYDRHEGTIGPWSGSGREALLDGSHTGAAYAQPSGIARHGDTLYVADSETSALRAVEVSSGSAHTLAGVGLFDFGLADGPRATARMQHPLDVTALDAHTLVVADTYNDALRAFDLRTHTLTTLYRADGERSLRDPAGLAVRDDGTLLVADTGHHRVVTIDRAGAWLGAFEVHGAPRPRFDDGASDDEPEAPPRDVALAGFFTAAVSADEGAALGPGRASLTLSVTAPEGWTFAAGSGARVLFEVSRRSDLWTLEHDALAGEGDGSDVLTFTVAATIARLPDDVIESELLATVDAVLCAKGPEAVCVPARGWFRLPVTLRREGRDGARYALPLSAPV